MKYHIIFLKQCDEITPSYDENEEGRFTLHLGNEYYEGSVYMDKKYAMNLKESLKEVDGGINYKEIEIN